MQLPEDSETRDARWPPAAEVGEFPEGRQSRGTGSIQGSNVSPVRGWEGGSKAGQDHRGSGWLTRMTSLPPKAVRLSSADTRA